MPTKKKLPAKTQPKPRKQVEVPAQQSAALRPQGVSKDGSIEAQREVKVMGYLPDDTPPIGAMLSLGFQQFLTMFPSARSRCITALRFHISQSSSP